MVMSISLLPEHSWVGGIAVGTFLVNLYLGGLVGGARKKYKVPYPNMYLPATDENAVPFNSTQRAHQNYLEQLPGFLVLLTIAGAFYPKPSTAFGAVWLLGRILYAQGYIAGGPQGRFKGVIQYIGNLGLLVLSIRGLIALGRS